jgi:hypothetical protein
MKRKLNSFLLLAVVVFSCNVKTKVEEPASPLTGTWKLLSGTLIEKGDTTTTDYTKDLSMIKIINATHFSFLNHDINRAKDSLKVFVAGGGRYKLNGDQYTELLEYCSDRNWEGHEFKFTVEIKGDTLTQTGVEKLEDVGIERLNMEKYVRVK